MFFFRTQNDIYLDLMWNGLDDIERRTGCQKPCIFKKYSFPGDTQVVLQISIKCADMTLLKLNINFIQQILYLEILIMPKISNVHAGDINEIKYLLYLPNIIFGKYLLYIYQMCRQPHLNRTISFSP